MQIDTFVYKRMKMLYVLLFMHGGMAQVWAANETSAVLANMSTINTLEELLASIERTFGDPDQERMACTQLHALKMMPGMTMEEYMANFEMLFRRTGFNEATLEDAYVCGLLSHVWVKNSGSFNSD